MAATEKAIQIAPKSDAKIKEKISRKLNRKPNPESYTYNPIATILVSIMGIFAIIPAVILGVFVFFGAGFRSGSESTVRMYGELMEDAKKWAK